MSKQRKVRRIVLDKLYSNNTTHLKKSTRSNAPTESTPNEPKINGNAIEHFFDSFDTECAIIYEPVHLSNHKNIKRSLFSELKDLHNQSRKAQEFKKALFQDTYDVSKYTHARCHQNSRFDAKASFINPSPFIEGQSVKSQLFKREGSGSKTKQIETQFSKISSPTYQKCNVGKNCNEMQKSYAKRATDNVKVVKSKSYRNLNNVSPLQAKRRFTLVSRSDTANAPKKTLEKSNFLGQNQKIKRVQSLKNLTENGRKQSNCKKK